MKIDDCFYLGYISKTIGTKGELAFKLDVDSPSSYEDMDAVFIQNRPKDSQLIPYFLSHAVLQNDKLLRCKIEDIDEQTTAKSFVGKSIYLALDKLPKLKPHQFYFHEVIGFSIIDVEKGKLGKVSNILEFPNSNLFSVTVKQKEVLIPILDEIIQKVDKPQREIVVKCPEGLIDLYLEN